MYYHCRLCYVEVWEPCSFPIYWQLVQGFAPSRSLPVIIKQKSWVQAAQTRSVLCNKTRDVFSCAENTSTHTAHFKRSRAFRNWKPFDHRAFIFLPVKTASTQTDSNKITRFNRCLLDLWLGNEMRFSGALHCWTNGVLLQWDTCFNRLIR